MIHVTHNAITTTLCGEHREHGEPHAITLHQARAYHARHELGSWVTCLDCCRRVREWRND